MANISATIITILIAASILFALATVFSFFMRGIRSLFTRTVFSRLTDESRYFSYFKKLTKGRKTTGLLNDLLFLKNELNKKSISELKLLKASTNSMEKSIQNFQPIAVILGLIVAILTSMLSATIKNTSTKTTNIGDDLINATFAIVFVILIFSFVFWYYNRNKKVALLKEVIDICIEEKINALERITIKGNEQN